MKAIEFQKVVGPFACNCRCLVCPTTGDALLLDPGDEAPALAQWLTALRTPSGMPVRIKWLMHTHGHLDHVGATRALKGQHPDAKIAIHRGDAEIYAALKEQGRRFGFEYDDPLPPEHWLEDNQEIRVGKLKFSIVHTPGHSPGCVCVRLHEDSGLQAAETLYTGDTLFRGDVGRTDLWGASEDQMFHSIRSRIVTHDDGTRVCPGHGPNSTIGIEKRSNPYLQ